MKKELFIETIDALREQFDNEAQLVFHINQHIEGEIYSFGKSRLMNQIIKLLQQEFPPRKSFGVAEFCNIEYFCFEINFGREWREGLVTEDGIDIKLQTPEDLWNYLNYIKEKE